ncbi:MAG: hypothetical protein MJZ16_05150 [Bacteroidales bacterium]|nr:hypothetical protein [Bacteroidales bacterium]
MKKIIITLVAVLAFTAVATAQPKSIGGRFGYMGLEVSYEHNMAGANFLELNGGLDFGWNGDPGFIASGIYNFMIAQPNWSRGEWGFYAGPGAFAGYLDDKIKIDHYDNQVGVAHASGFAFGITGQVGLEYTFWFPLQLSVDVRPYLGLHINGDGKHDVYPTKVGLYDRGANLGLAPTLSVRYRF